MFDISSAAPIPSWGTCRRTRAVSRARIRIQEGGAAHSPPAAKPCSSRNATSRAVRRARCWPRFGDQADGQRRKSHHHQRRDQRPLTADPVAEVPEHSPTDGRATNAEANAPSEATVAMVGPRCGKKPSEHQRGGGSVDEEVVELDRRAGKLANATRLSACVLASIPSWWRLGRPSRYPLTDAFGSAGRRTR